MSMITSVFYAQSAEDVELANRINNLVKSHIPYLVGKDYFILSTNSTDTFIVSKISNSYTYYKLSLKESPGAEITSKIISTIPILDKIFTNFVPKTGVKRYVSEYGHNVLKDYILFKTYFAIYKNGVKTFDTCLPPYLDDKRIESPIDEEILTFLYVNVLLNPDKL